MATAIDKLGTTAFVHLNVSPVESFDGFLFLLLFSSSSSVVAWLMTSGTIRIKGYKFCCTSTARKVVASRSCLWDMPRRKPASRKLLHTVIVWPTQFMIEYGLKR